MMDESETLPMDVPSSAPAVSSSQGAAAGASTLEDDLEALLEGNLTQDTQKPTKPVDEDEKFWEDAVDGQSVNLGNGSTALGAAPAEKQPLPTSQVSPEKSQSLFSQESTLETALEKNH